MNRINTCPLCEVGTFKEITEFNFVSHDSKKGMIKSKASICNYCGAYTCNKDQAMYNKQEMLNFMRGPEDNAN